MLFRSNTALLLTRLSGVLKLVSLVGTRIRTRPLARIPLTTLRTRQRQLTVAPPICQLQGTRIANASARKASAFITRNQDIALLSVRKRNRMLFTGQMQMLLEQ